MKIEILLFSLVSISKQVTFDPSLEAQLSKMMEGALNDALLHVKQEVSQKKHQVSYNPITDQIHHHDQVEVHQQEIHQKLAPKVVSLQVDPSPIELRPTNPIISLNQPQNQNPLISNVIVKQPQLCDNCKKELDHNQLASILSPHIENRTKLLEGLQKQDENTLNQYHNQAVRPELVVIESGLPIDQENLLLQDLAQLEKQSRNPPQLSLIDAQQANDPNFDQNLSKILNNLANVVRPHEQPLRPNENQKAKLDHIEASETPTHVNFTKVNAKQHKIPKKDIVEGKVNLLDALQDILPNKQKII